jgi:CRISPR/Cas system CSM-associated protein Csm2 small subunit
MKKKCEKCKKEFEARDPRHRYCPDCFTPSQNAGELNEELLLKDYYDEHGNVLKGVYIDIPQKLANRFANDRPALGTKQLREFHQRILKARNKAILKSIDVARSILYKCRADLEYQLKRGIIPQSFVKFMKHHLLLAEKSEKSVEGFYEHLDSIICYFPIKKERGGE